VSFVKNQHKMKICKDILCLYDVSCSIYLISLSVYLYPLHV